MSTWSEGYQEEINKLKSDLNLLERSIAKSEVKRYKLEEQNKIMKEALEEIINNFDVDYQGERSLAYTAAKALMEVNK